MATQWQHVNATTESPDIVDCGRVITMSCVMAESTNVEQISVKLNSVS